MRKKDDKYDSLKRVRKPIPRPGCLFKDKSKYSRKRKHKGDGGWD